MISQPVCFEELYIMHVVGLDASLRLAGMSWN